MRKGIWLRDRPGVLQLLWAINQRFFFWIVDYSAFAFLLSAFLQRQVTNHSGWEDYTRLWRLPEKSMNTSFSHEHFGEGPRKDWRMKRSSKLRKEKIKSALSQIHFYLSRFVIIALGTVADSQLHQIGVVSIIAILATVGVYGLVWLIVRMDIWRENWSNLQRRRNSFSEQDSEF